MDETEKWMKRKHGGEEETFYPAPLIQTLLFYSSIPLLPLFLSFLLV